ncbi:MAG: helix-turn-helix domain-containing protein, partial [Myxococcota bacterium]
ARVTWRRLRAEPSSIRTPGQPASKSWSRPSSASRFEAARRILMALAESRRANPEALLGRDQLFEAGWPGVRIDEGSARNRLHVTLAKLRKLGLKPFLLREAEGYRLDPDVPLRLVS